MLSPSDDPEGGGRCRMLLLWSFLVCWALLMICLLFSLVVLPLWLGLEMWGVPCDRPLAPVMVAWGVYWSAAINAYLIEQTHGLSLSARRGWRAAARFVLLALTAASNAFVFSSATCEATSASRELWPAVDLGSLYKESKDYTVSTDFAVGLLLVFIVFTLVAVWRAPKVDGEPHLRPYSQLERFRHHSPEYYLVLERFMQGSEPERPAGGAGGYRAVGPGHRLDE